ncbi:MAG TPA: histidine kinase N-terminal 7TM domain-containing protein, partial [Candidatus Omnitrophota bacterium]|nr:histidine kinase N-terminal 7TM domain-containing protein [Candidatus Omnitrophota bacterium]
MLLNIYSFVLLVIFLINCGLGLYIFIKGRRIESNRAFSYLLVSIALWVLTGFIFLMNRQPEWTLFLRRLTPAAASLVAVCFLYFSLAFPAGRRVYPVWFKSLIGLPALLFALLSVSTPWLIPSFEPGPLDTPFIGTVGFGTGYYLFGLFFIFYFAAGLTHLVMRYVRSAGRDRLQIFYVLFGIASAGILSILTSLVLPLLGYGNLFIFGPPFTLLMTLSVAYAIIKHNLMEMEYFLSRGLTFLTLVLFVCGTLYFIFSGDFRYLLAFYVVLANASTAFFVLFNNPKSRLNQIFSLLALTVAAWSFSLSVFQMGGSTAWAMLTYAFASLIPAVNLSFVRVFPKYDEAAGPVDLLSYIFAIVLFLLSFSRLIIVQGIAMPWGFTLELGPLYGVFAVYFVGIILYGFSRLFNKYRRTSGISRVQILYVAMGTLIAVTIGATTAIILPLLGFPRLYYLAPPATLIMIGFIAYAIVKHRLMSIEIVIQKSTVYGVATIFIMALYAFSIAISEKYLRSIFGYTSLLITSAAALLIAIAYQPLVGFFQNVADRIFFRDRYDYQKTLRRISQEIATVIKLEELTKLIVSSFIDTMKVSEISFLLNEKEGEHFRSVPISIPRYKKIEIDAGNPIVSWLSRTRDVLVDDELDDAISRATSLGREGAKGLDILNQVKEGMERLGISVWVPINTKEGLVGIIALGKKLSGDVFTSEDIGLLSTLANQTSVALENARLYEEVVNMKDYNEEVLQSMVSGVLTVDAKGRVITFNSMAEKITGRAAAGIIGKTVREVWGERGTVTGVIEDTLKKEKRYVNFESGVISPEKGLVPVSFSSTILYDHKRKKNGVLL